VRRTDEGGIVERDGFLRFDLAVSQDLPWGADVSLGARNLLDARPDDWPGFSRRHVYLSLGWNTADGARR
jgi:outer membrane receptor protein involved in Fe transport